MSEWCDFNVNHKVRIKVTERGREVMCKKIDTLNDFLRTRTGAPLLPYRELKEDAEGWSTWQLWDVIATFGESTGMGMPVCFETTIQFALPDPPPPAAGKDD